MSESNYETGWSHGAAAVERKGPLWSEVLPSSEGWYWFRRSPGSQASVKEVRRILHGGGYAYSALSDGQWIAVSWFGGNWAGPLVPPQSVDK